MVVCEKKQKQCQAEELEVGDCWVALSLAQQSGLILAARVGKHTDELLLELVVSTEGKTTCQNWNTDGWGGYERVLPETVDHYIGKALTQPVERTNGTLRQQTGLRASTTEYERLAGESFLRQLSQVWQALGSDNGDSPISRQLFQLDLVPFQISNDSGSTGRISHPSLVMG